MAEAAMFTVALGKHGDDRACERGLSLAGSFRLDYSEVADSGAGSWLRTSQSSV